MRTNNLRIWWTTMLTLAIVLTSVLTLSVSEQDGRHKRKKTVVEGDNLLIVCNITVEPDLIVYWTTNNSKASFWQNGTKLEFINIKRTSSGDYACHAVNTSDYDNRTVEIVTVDVQYPAEVSGMYFGPNIVKEKETWSCGANIDANPDPKFRYYNTRTGVDLASANVSIKSFEVTSWPARCQDAGVYHVAAINYLNHGVWAFQAGNLTVICRPIPDPDSKINYTATAFMRDNATFLMEYVGYPAPDVTWEHGGRVLPASMQRNGMNSTSLLIHVTSIEDYGQYTVTLTNTMGSSSANFTLYPDGSPQRPYNMFCDDVTYNSVTLHWTSGFDMGTRQHFTVWKQVGVHQYALVSPVIYDNSPNHGIDQNWKYTITGLDNDTQYNFTVDSEDASDKYNSGFVVPNAHVRTLKSPHHYGNPGSKVAVIVGPSVGGVCAIALLAFLVYVIRYRRMRTSYETIKGKQPAP